MYLWWLVLLCLELSNSEIFVFQVTYQTQGRVFLTILFLAPEWSLSQ